MPLGVIMYGVWMISCIIEELYILYVRGPSQTRELRTNDGLDVDGMTRLAMPGRLHNRGYNAKTIKDMEQSS